MRPPMIYVAGPYSAHTKEERDIHVVRAYKIAQELWLRGYVVICPHLNTYGFEGSASLGDDNWEAMFKMFLVGDFEIISRCDAVVMLPFWKQSKGACAEFVFAHWMGIPVYMWPDVPCSKDFANEAGCDEVS
jgi:hypothetical protein